MKGSTTTPDFAYLKSGDIRQMLGISRDKFRELVDDGTLPPPLTLGPKTRRWARTELIAHLQKRMSAAA